MKRRLTGLLAAASLMAGLASVGPAVPLTFALGSTTISTAITFATADAMDLTVDGVFTVTGDLTITSTGSITCDDPLLPTGASACPIKIVVTGKLLMEAGSAITAENNVDGGSGGAITITVGGDMTMCGPNGGQLGCASPGAPDGALISARKKSSASGGIGGFITITVGDKTTATGVFYMEGGSTTYGAETGAKILTSGSGPAGDISVSAGETYFAEPGSVVEAGGPFQTQTATAQGGKIFLVSDCGLTSQGRVTSKGPDFGADLVHLESCAVLIQGLVESTGKGHVANAKNSCDNVNDGLPGEVLRAHPAASTGCIEVWGNHITIDSTTDPTHARPDWAGELNADIGNGGGEGTSWIDIFAFSQLTVTDGTGNDRISDNNGHIYFSTYAVHANAINGSDRNPSVVTALVKNGPLTASGKAFEASSTLTVATGHAAPTFVGNGSNGGTIDLEALGTVTLDTAFVNASGDFGLPTIGAGGHIIVSAWGTGSDLLWRNGSGDVRPASGTIALNACDLIAITPNDFHGEVPTLTHTCNATRPTIPTITAINGGPVFKTDLWALCGDSTVSGIKFNDLNGNHVQDGAELGLPGWEIKIWNLAQTVNIDTATTAANGSYSFTVVPGTYVVCETPQATWTQTAPVAGTGCNNGTIGYTVVLTGAVDCTGEQITGRDFGNQQLATKSGMKFNDADNSGSFTAGDTTIANWPINLLTTGNVVLQSKVTAANGTYSFTVVPGTYRVCEGVGPVPGFTQTFPNALTVHAGETIISTCPGANVWGYEFTVAGGDALTNDNFGNFKPPSDCEKLEVLTVMDPSDGRFPGNVGPDYVVHVNHGESIQAAVNAAAGPDSSTTGNINGDAYLIILVLAHDNGTLGGSTTQAVSITANYPLPFAVIACSVTLNDPTPNDANPVGLIAESAGSPGNIFVMDLHAKGSAAAGWKVIGNGRTLRNVVGSYSGVGIWFDGDGNTMHNGSVLHNTGVGLRIHGNGNFVTDTVAEYNGSHGIQVNGDNNTVQKTQLGDIGRRNLGDGLNLSGSNNWLQENTARTNLGVGIRVSGTGNTLKKNVSGGTAAQNNTGCEYNVVALNINAGENKANGVTVGGASFPTGCI